MIYNPNMGIVDKIKAALVKTNGYCPCEIQRTEDTICPCKKMREENICHCRLFVPVILYSADGCPNCMELREYLDNEGIKYEIRNTLEDKYRDELIKAGFTSVPVLKLGDLYIDTSTDEYKEYLNNRYSK